MTSPLSNSGFALGLSVCLGAVQKLSEKKMIHIKPKNIAVGYARRNIFGFYYFLQVPNRLRWLI
jgi:hypothetical protein